MKSHNVFLIFSILLIVIGCEQGKKSITPLQTISIGLPMKAAIQEIEYYRGKNMISNTHRVSIKNIRCRIDFHYCKSKIFKKHSLEGISLVPNDSTLIHKLFDVLKSEGLSDDIIIERTQIHNVRDLFTDFEATVVIHSDLLLIDGDSIIRCNTL